MKATASSRLELHAIARPVVVGYMNCTYVKEHTSDGLKRHRVLHVPNRRSEALTSGSSYSMSNIAFDGSFLSS